MALRQKVTDNPVCNQNAMDNIHVSVHYSEMVCALMGACETKSITCARIASHFNAEMLATSFTMNGKDTRA